MAQLRFEVMVLLFLESLLLLGGGAVALLNKDLLLQQLLVADASPEDQLDAVVQLLAATLLGAGVLLLALINASDASAASFAVPLLVPVDVTFAALTFQVLRKKIDDRERDALIFFGLCVVVVLVRAYYAFAAGVTIPHSTVVHALRPATAVHPPAALTTAASPAAAPSSPTLKPVAPKSPQSTTRSRKAKASAN
jgi:hypothetical protein